MPLQTPDPAKLISRCAAAVSSDYDNCGAITACNLVVMTPDQVNALFMTNAAGTANGTGAADDRFRVLGEVFTADFEGRMVGVRPNGLYDFLLSQTKILSPRKLSITEIAPGYWEIAPFVKMKRKRAMSEEYWKATLAAVTADWNVNTIVSLNLTPQLPDQWKPGATSLLIADVSYFPVGQRLFLSGLVSGAGGAVYRLALEITESPAGGITPPAGSVAVKAKITAADWGTAAAGPIAPGVSPGAPPLTLNAVAGLVFRGTPNVSDYERWCSEIPKIRSDEMLPFWVETTRYSMCHDDMVESFMQALLKNNEYYREWIHVDEVQHNKRIVEDFQRRHAYTIFFNMARPGQTLATYQQTPPTGLDKILVSAPGAKYASLNQAFFAAPSGANLNAGVAVKGFNSSALVDPTSGAGRCIGYKANAVGIYPQLAECGRVIDMLGGGIDLYKFLNTLAYLQRARRSAGVPSEIIEVLTDSRSAYKAAYAIATYFGVQINAEAAKYHAGGAAADWYRVTQQLGKECPSNWGFRCLSFNLDYPVAELRFSYNEALDDVLSAFSSLTMGNAGRFFWLVDWSNVYAGIIESNSVVNKTGNLQDLAKADDQYMCVMKVPSRSQKLISQTYTVVVEDETTSLVFENIGDIVFAQTSGVRSDDLTSTYVQL